MNKNCNQSTKIESLTFSIEYSTMGKEKTLPAVDKTIEKMKQQPNGISVNVKVLEEL